MRTTLTCGRSRVWPMIEVVVVSLAMVLFALVVHESWPLSSLSAVALVVIAATVACSRRDGWHPAALLGMGALSREIIRLSLVAALVGAVVGSLYGQGLGMSVWIEEGLGRFATVACLIGATEELLYRGWVLGRMRLFGSAPAIVTAAIAHAAYKTALFALAPESSVIELAGILSWTLIGGILLGLLRVRSMSVIPPMFAHAAFDLMVYGGLTNAPWWVWS